MSVPMSAVSDLAFSVENESGCNERPIILRALRDGARDFCTRSEAWVNDIRYDNDPESNIYDGAGSQDAYVLRVLSVDYLYKGYTERLCDHEFTKIDQNMIRLFKNHKNVSQIRIKSVLIPNPGENELPEELVIAYRDGLVYGACVRIARQVGKPWFSPELEQMFQMNFLREVTKAITRFK